jgi:hypothetical protein
MLKVKTIERVARPEMLQHQAKQGLSYNGST